MFRLEHRQFFFLFFAFENLNRKKQTQYSLFVFTAIYSLGNIGATYLLWGNPKKFSLNSMLTRNLTKKVIYNTINLM